MQQNTYVGAAAWLPGVAQTLAVASQSLLLLLLAADVLPG
jgi:hypothetical protein